MQSQRSFPYSVLTWLVLVAVGLIVALSLVLLLDRSKTPSQSAMALSSPTAATTRSTSTPDAPAAYPPPAVTPVPVWTVVPALPRVTVAPTPTAPQPEPTLPGPMPPGPKVLYRDTRAGIVSLYAANPANPRMRRLLSTIEDPSQFGVHITLSHDESRFAYTVLPPQNAGHTSHLADLWVMNIDGTQRRQLASKVDMGRWINYPLWSSDDRLIAFNRSDSAASSGHIVIMDVETGQEAKIGGEDETAWWPLGFSPDGEYFYYFGGRKGQGGLWRVEVTQRESADYRRTEYVTPLDGVNQLCYFLSPDGKWVLCSTSSSDNPNRHRIIRISTTPGVGAEMLMDNMLEVGSIPIWHPQGRNVTSGARSDITDSVPLRNIDLPTRRTTPLPASLVGQFRPRSWSPDGTWLVIESIPVTNRSLRLLRSDGQADVELVGMGGIDAIGWLTRDVPSERR